MACRVAIVDRSLVDCCAAGERLGVALSESDTLRQSIRRREWDDSARRLMASASAKTTVNTLSEALEEAVAMGAQGSEVYEQLKAKVEAAQVGDVAMQGRHS